MFNNTYIAILVIRVFRALVALIAYFNLNMWQFNAINAFINASLNKEVYI
jgi:hypothetical protein